MKTFAYLAFIAAGATAMFFNLPHAKAESRPTPVPHTAYDPSLTAKEATFNLQRVKNDPGGSIGWRQLASAYLAEGRERDSQELAKKAEAAALESLKLRTNRNAASAIVLSNALLEQHRFVEAEAACQQALRMEPGADAAERQMTDIDFELGKYDEAVKFIDSHPEWRNDPSGLTLFARRAEVYGHPKEAEGFLRDAVDLVESDYEATATTTAWFHIKYGELLARNGELDAAESQYRAGLQEYPTSWKALADMARLKALQGDWDGVLFYGKKLNSIAPMTDVLGLMEDAARGLGYKQDADMYASQVLKLNQSTIDFGLKPHSPAQLKAGHTHDRMFCMYLAEQGKMLDLAQHAATHELANRKDVYTYDMYGWVTFQWAKSRNSKPEMVEAKQAVDKALATGIQDAKIFYHAGVIENALGHKEEAKDRLTEALKLNPNFGPYDVVEAKRLLASL